MISTVLRIIRSQAHASCSHRYDQKIAFYRDVPEILHRLRAAGVTIAACSRTHAPDLYVIHVYRVVLHLNVSPHLYSARKALSLLLVPPAAGHKDASPTTAIQFFDQLEIYPGTLSRYQVLGLSSHCPNILPYPRHFVNERKYTGTAGSKIKHFKELHKKTGLSYSEMVRLVHANLYIPPTAPADIPFSLD